MTVRVKLPEPWSAFFLTQPECGMGYRRVDVRLTDFATLRDCSCCDADSGKDLATELREYFIPDFSPWKEYAPFGAGFGAGFGGGSPCGKSAK